MQDTRISWPNHTITVYTGRIDSRDPAMLDITVKSASTPEGRALAPTWDLVRSVKEGQITEAEYTRRYTNLLRARYADDPAPFLSIIRRDRVVLTCYCPAGAFCHRHIVAGVLTAIAAKQGFTVVLGGELVRQPDKPQQMRLL